MKWEEILIQCAESVYVFSAYVFWQLLAAMMSILLAIMKGLIMFWWSYSDRWNRTTCPGVCRSVSTRSHNLPGHRCRCNTSLSASLANLLLTELAKTSWHGYTVCANISTECYVSFQGLTEWLTPHMKTLRTGSLARNTFTFCCTKCFFLVLVLGARITIGLEEGPELPRAAMTTHRLSSLVHRGDTSSWWLKLKQLTLASPSLPGSLTPTKGRAPVVLDRSGATI